MQKTAGRAILEGLAAEQRRVFAAWRALILLRRATFSIPASERRWSHLPKQIFDLTPILRQMERREEIARLPRLGYVYEVTVPYAATGSLDEYALLMEIHPYCTLSHASALNFHGLTNDLEKRITVTAAVQRPVGEYPSGTTVEDWEGLSLVSGTRAARILDHPIHWSTVKPSRFFGIGEYHRFGYPLRVTDRDKAIYCTISRIDSGQGETFEVTWSDGCKNTLSYFDADLFDEIRLGDAGRAARRV